MGSDLTRGSIASSNHRRAVISGSQGFRTWGVSPREQTGNRAGRVRIGVSWGRKRPNQLHSGQPDRGLADAATRHPKGDPGHRRGCSPAMSSTNLCSVASGSSVHPQCFERGRLRVAVKDRVHVFHDVATDFQELAFVFDRDQRLFHTVVHGQLQGLGE